MAQHYRHTNGAHAVLGWREGLSSQLFLSEQPVDSFAAVLRPKVSPSGRIAYVANEPGQFPDGTAIPGGGIVVRELDGRQWLASEGSVGQRPMAWLGERLVVMIGGDGNANTSTFLVVEPQGQPSTFTLNKYGSEGIARVVAIGDVVLGNERHAPRVVDGVGFTDWDEEDGVIVGFIEAGHPQFGAVGRYANGVITMWPCTANLQEPATVSGGRVAISGPDTPAPDAIPWQPYAPFGATAPAVSAVSLAPAPPAPTPPPIVQAPFVAPAPTPTVSRGKVIIANGSSVTIRFPRADFPAAQVGVFVPVQKR